MTPSAEGCFQRVRSPRDGGSDRTIGKVLTDEQIDGIEARRNQRKASHDRIPAGPYFYDSMGFVYNEIRLRPDGTPKRRTLRAGLLARRADWFYDVDMGANTTRADSEVGTDLGQYVPLALGHDPESDVEAISRCC